MMIMSFRFYVYNYCNDEWPAALGLYPFWQPSVKFRLCCFIVKYCLVNKPSLSVLMQSSATIDWWEQDWNEVMMPRLLKLSEAKQREHVHLGDVSRSTHGKYDVCSPVLVLRFFFATFVYLLVL